MNIKISIFLNFPLADKKILNSSNILSEKKDMTIQNETSKKVFLEKL